MEIKDLAGLSKPLCKLIDVFQNGCSWALKPTQIKRIAFASSEASSTNTSSDFKKHLKEALLEDTINATHSVREKRQLNNIASIYANAAQELQMIENVDSTPVDPDWSVRFFDYSKDVSNEEAQIIWAKILSEEIIKPKSFFKRTLSILRNIEPFEAKWFSDICQFVLDDSYILYYIVAQGYYSVNRFQSLIDCGLINSIKCDFILNEDKMEIHGKAQTIKLILPQTGSIPIIHLGTVYLLTDAGSQLYKITPSQTNQTYLMKLKKDIENRYNIESELTQMSQ